MTGGYIEKRLKKTNRRMITVGAIVLTVTLLVLFLSFSYYWAFFTGPLIVTGQDLADDASDYFLDNEYVQIEFDEFYDSGIYDTSTDGDGNEVITLKYYVATLGDYQIIVSSKSGISGKTFTGELFTLNDWAADEFFNKISELTPNSTKTFLPIVLTDDNYMQRGYFGLGLAALFLFLAILFIVVGTRRKYKPELHPSMKELAKLGPIEFVVSRIDTEMAYTHEAIGKNHFLANHLLIETRSGVSVVKYDDIVWAYKVSLASRNFGIHFGTVDALMVHDRSGRELFVPCKAADLNRMMSLLLPHIPYAFKGYTEELASSWRNDPTILTRAMDERKTAVSAPQGIPPLPGTEKTDDPLPDEN